jgi:hypothetical protein
MSPLQQHTSPLFRCITYRSSPPQPCPDLDGWSLPPKITNTIDQLSMPSRPSNSYPSPRASFPRTMGNDIKVESPPTSIRDLQSDTRLSFTDHTPKRLGRPQRSARSRQNHHDSIEVDKTAETLASPPRKRHYNRKTKGASEQERLDLKREKNRIAASKCRDKKMIWEKNLEEHARRLQDNNMQLSIMLTSMTRERLNLKELIMRHSINSPNCSRSLLDSMAPDLLPVSQTSRGGWAFSLSEKSVHDPWEDAMRVNDARGDDVAEMDQFFELLKSQDD